MMSSKRSSSSVAIIEGNDDLLTELILLFLPPKSLGRFKLVRKQWCSLISAPSFCGHHNLHHPRRRPETHPLFLIGGGIDSRYYDVCNPTVPGFFPFPLDFDYPIVEIVQSCNGLLLLRCRLKEYGRNHYYVFNPTTMQQRDLAPLPFRAVSGIYLMFDPSLSPHYRVVCFVYTKRTCTVVHVYDSEVHEWKSGAEPITKRNCHDGIYFKGGIYLRFGSPSSRFNPDEHNLSNVLALPKLPRPLSYWGRHRLIYVANGVVHLLSKQEGNLIHVYETKEIESGWTKKYQLDFNPVLEGSECLELLGMSGGEKLEDSLLLFIVSEKLMSYRFCDSVFEVLLDFGKNGCTHGTQEIHHFIQTLAPV